MNTINVTVNGKKVCASVEPRTLLADFLRETLNLTGTHLGCEHGVCGACTLLVDGVPVRSCITLAVACDGASITTIEGLDRDDLAATLREAFSREHALQCGYCTPGMLASARDVVMRMPAASERDIRVAMSGNLCRCTGYVGIVRAIERVLADRKAKGLSATVNPRAMLGPAGSGHAQASTTEGSTRSAQSPAVAAPSPPSPLPKGEGGIEALKRIGMDGEGSVSLPSPSGRGTDLLLPSPPGRGIEGEGRLTTLQQSLSVDHPRDKVWDFFGRLDEVAACLPGVSLLEGSTGDRVNARLRVKAGPIVAEFEGTVGVHRDPSNYSGTIHGSARDARSGTTARGEIRYTLRDEQSGAATRLDIEVGYKLAGPLAQLGRSKIVQDIAKRMTAAFAQNLRARLAGTAAGAQAHPTADLNAGSLVFAAIWDRIKRFLRSFLGR